MNSSRGFKQRPGRPIGLYYDPQRYRAENFSGLSRQNLQRLYTEYAMSERYIQFHFDRNTAAEPVELHSHAHYELIYCTRAAHAAYLVGRERFCLEDGDLICIRPGVHHRPLFGEDMCGPFERIILLIDPRLADRVAEAWADAPEQNPFRHAVLRAGARVSDRLRDQFEAGARGACQQTAQKLEKIGLAFQILSLMSRAAADRCGRLPPASQTELLDEIIDYVETHYMQKLSLAGVAEHFFVSPSTISHVCREQMQVSFYQFVQQRRLVEAKALIAKGAAPTDVSALVGFSDYQNFYRAFKGYYGLSPREFKKMASAGTAPP